LFKNNAMPKTRDSLLDFIYGTAWKEERTAALTELAIRTGFRAIDTANQRKHFEAAVGQGLAVTYREGVVTRADLFLQTKFNRRRWIAERSSSLQRTALASFGSRIGENRGKVDGPIQTGKLD
jgi:diketogulonate reductase-like aldo/keto reductase